jgi:hypothetical protein
VTATAEEMRSTAGCVKLVALAPSVEGRMSALDDLQKLRELLVATRRNVAAQGVKNPKDIGQWGIDVEALQGRIEAVDKAIEDEKKIAGSSAA